MANASTRSLASAPWVTLWRADCRNHGQDRLFGLVVSFRDLQKSDRERYGSGNHWELFPRGDGLVCHSEEQGQGPLTYLEG